MQHTNQADKSQTQSAANSRVLFLTQQNTFSPLRKKQLQAKQYAQQIENPDLWQMNKLCDKLLAQVTQLKTQQTLSLYRQINRTISQGFIEKQGEMNKLQKVTQIDIGFLRKKLQNEPPVDFTYFNQRISAFQQQANQVSGIIQECNQRVSAIQKQFG